MIAFLNKYVVVKLLLLLLVFSTISTGSLLAQKEQPSGQKFSLGVKGGPLITWSDYADDYDARNTEAKIKWGFFGAGIISFPMKDNYSCVIEAGYSKRGRNVEFEGKKNYATYNFLDVALLLRKSFKVNLAKNVPGTMFVNVGPHISYWLGGEGTIGNMNSDGTPYKIEFVDTFDIQEADFNTMYMVDANRWLFGADIGIGMTAPIRTTQRVLVEFRFMWGHTFYGGRTTANYSWIDFTDNNMRANERILSITAAYMFDFDSRVRKTGRSTKDKEVKRKPVRRRR